MINLAVINLKDIINFIKNFLIGIIIFILLIKICGNIKKGNYVKIEDLKEKSFFDYCKIIDRTLVISNYYNKKENTINKSGMKKILGAELAILEAEEELMEKENQEEAIVFEELKNENITEKNIVEDGIRENVEIDEIENPTQEVAIEKKENLDEIENVLATEVIKENNKTDTYTDVYKSVKIKNESKYQLTEKILTPDFELSNKDDVIIYHTHTCESYTPTQENNYEASGNFRTTDLNYNVSRVGSELETYLKGIFNVKHNSTYHDYPAYSGSYTRSLSTIKNIVSKDYSRISN